MDSRISKKSCENLYDMLKETLEKEGSKISFSKEAFLTSFNTDGKYIDISKFIELSDEQFIKVLHIYATGIYPDDVFLNDIMKEKTSHERRVKTLYILQEKKYGGKIYFKNNIYFDDVKKLYTLKEKMKIIKRKIKYLKLKSIQFVLSKMSRKLKDKIKKIIRKG